MKVVALTGPESSGKSWLGALLRDRFGGVLVDEYVRHFIEREQRDTTYADIDAIARGQLAWEDEARARAPALLLLDTHLLSNIQWSRTLFGDCPDWLEPALLARQYDVHLLLSPHDVPWCDDGQRCQPSLTDRTSYFEEARQWLVAHDQPHQVLAGDWAARSRQGIAIIEALLSGPESLPGPTVRS